MRAPEPLCASARPPALEQLDFDSLCRQSEYEVRTADGWTLVITRFQPVRQRFEQTVFGAPLLLVHGFSQNRHAWSTGDFVKQMLVFGVDVHLLELRGHGKSSVELQRRKAAAGVPLPADIDYDWDIDSYFLFDLPAAVAGVKSRTGRSSIFYCGHSMGGMLGYGYAGLYDDLAGLVAIGAPTDLGRGFFALKLAAWMLPATRLVDGYLVARNSFERALHSSRLAIRSALCSNWLTSRLAPSPPAGNAPCAHAFRYVPVDLLARKAERLLAERDRWLGYVWPYLGFLPNLSRVGTDDVRWLLREGGEREPRKVVEQFARWIRNGELVCYRTGYDFKVGFPRIEIPVAIIFGDLDRLASRESTRGLYEAARSEYLLWRPVKGNSHIELTISQDTRQICFDIKSLIEYARNHRGRRPLFEGEGPAPGRRSNILN